MLCSLIVAASVAVAEEERAVERSGLNQRGNKEYGGCSIMRRHRNSDPRERERERKVTYRFKDF
jgi:hypothetical protein